MPSVAPVSRFNPQSLVAGLRGQYALALATGYGAVIVNNGSQLLLVPFYLHALGKHEFGVLMIVFGFVNAASAGVAWLTGGMLRILGEYSARGDSEGFARAFALLRLGYLLYAVALGIVLLAIVAISGDRWFQDVPPAARSELLRGVQLCGLYLVVLYDLSVERLALTAARRQAAANNLFGFGVVAYVSLVIPWLLAGGSFAGVIGCLIAGTAIASVASRIYRRRVGLHSRLARWDDDARVVLRRVVGPMGLGYFAYGVITLGMGADVLLVGWLGGAVLAAEFALLWKPAEVLTQILWKLPEHSAPFLIRMDALGERARLMDLYRRGLNWITALALVAGGAYAILGPWLLRLWIGESAPRGRLGFVLAGAAVFWLAVARLPSVFAYSTVRLRQLLTVSGIEFAAKTALTMILFSRAGYLAPVIAINLVHLLGLGVAYRRLMNAPSSAPLPSRPAEV